MNVNQLAEAILKEVGGKGNIKELFHCVTRLRFYLKDRSVIDAERIKKLDGVLGVQFQTEQLQIIIGNDVENVYNAMINKVGFVMDDVTAEKKQKMRIGGLFETISAIILPVIPVMAGTGILKGVITIMTSYLGFEAASDLIQMLTIAADVVFYFMPFFIAWSAAKRFKTDTALALALAGCLLYPTMTAGLAGGLSPMHLFGLPIPFVKYAASSIPIIFSVWVLKYVYDFVDKHVPQMLRLVFTPMIVILIMCPITLGVTGPIANYLSKGIAAFFVGLFAFSPILAGLVIGATRSLLVFTGMHLSLGAVCMQNLAQYGYDVILPVNTMGTLAIVGVCFGVWIKAKKQENKSIAMSAFVSSFIGITEPGIYGVLLKFKNALIADIIAGAVAGAFVAFFGGRSSAYVNSCILSLPVFVGPGFVYVCIGMVIAFVLGAVLVCVLGVNEGESGKMMTAGKAAAGTAGTAAVTAGNPAAESAGKVAAVREAAGSADAAGLAQTVASPMDGELIPMSQVEDKVFSSETLGKGVAIVPENGTVSAPFDGTVTTVYASKHAIGLTSDQGMECIIHIGLDTVNLKGKYFDIKVKDGQKVKRGDLLAQVDIDSIRKEGYSLTTPVIVANTSAYLDVFANQETGRVSRGTTVVTAIR